LISAALADVCDAVRAAGADAVVWSGPASEAATVRAAAGGVSLVVRCPDGDIEPWLAAGADRVGRGQAG